MFLISNLCNLCVSPPGLLKLHPLFNFCVFSVIFYKGEQYKKNQVFTMVVSRASIGEHSTIHLIGNDNRMRGDIEHCVGSGWICQSGSRSGA